MKTEFILFRGWGQVKEKMIIVFNFAVWLARQALKAKLSNEIPLFGLCLPLKLKCISPPLVGGG